MSYLGIAYCLYAFLGLVSMATMSIGAAVLGGALVVSYGSTLWPEFRRQLADRSFRYYLWASMALTLACALSLIVAWISPMGFGKNKIEVHFWSDMAKAWYLFWPIPIAMGLARISDFERKRVIQIWLWTFGVLSVIGVIQFFVGWPKPNIIPDYPTRYHVTAFLGHHLSAASIFIFPFFAALDAVRTGGRRFIPLVLLGAAALLLTHSRTLWIALPVGLFIWMLWMLPKKTAWIVVLGFLIVGGVATRLPIIQGRFENKFSLVQRKELWEANWLFFKTSPATGTGWMHNHDLSAYYMESIRPGGWNIYGHAHNNFLQMLSGTGLIGFIAFLIWLGVVTWVFWANTQTHHKTRQALGFSIGLMCAWVVFNINGITQVNIWEGKVQHQLAWMIGWALFWRANGQTKTFY